MKSFICIKIRNFQQSQESEFILHIQYLLPTPTHHPCLFSVTCLLSLTTKIPGTIRHLIFVLRPVGMKIDVQSNSFVIEQATKPYILDFFIPSPQETYYSGNHRFSYSIKYMEVTLGRVRVQKRRFNWSLISSSWERDIPRQVGEERRSWLDFPNEASVANRRIGIYRNIIRE